MNRLPDTSIIIVNWNVRQFLADCLTSLSNDPLIKHAEIIVVDNCSGDGSTEMLRAEFPNVRLIRNSENVGFARANNQAIRECSGRYVLLLNPDTRILDDALSTLVRFLNEHPCVGAVGPRLLNSNGSLQHGCYPQPTLVREFWRLFHLDVVWPFGVYAMEAWPLDTPRYVDVLLGACLMLRREALDQVGLLSEDYYMFSEEVDLCHRLQRANWRLVWLPEARVVHYGGQSTNQVADDMFLRLYEGKILYFRKNHGALTAKLYKLILAAASLARLAAIPLAQLEPPCQRLRHSVQAARYRQLLAALPRM